MPESKHTARFRAMLASMGIAHVSRRTDEREKDVLLLPEEAIIMLADQIAQIKAIADNAKATINAKDAQIADLQTQLAAAQSQSTADNPDLATALQELQAAGLNPVVTQAAPPADTTTGGTGTDTVPAA